MADPAPPPNRSLRLVIALGVVSLAALATFSLGRTAETERQARESDQGGAKRYAYVKPTKIRREGDKLWVWAGRDADTETDEWFDFTGSPVPAHELQYGIGKDRIPAIDDPVFVDPDDSRLMDIGPSRYRRDERAKHTNEIMVIGYVAGEDARAYPTALLDRHELVNDVIAGKPVTVGW
jgi:hypothetical protein